MADAKDAHNGDDEDDVTEADGAAWVERLRSGSRMRDVIADDDNDNGNDVDDVDPDPTTV